MKKNGRLTKTIVFLLLFGMLLSLSGLREAKAGKMDGYLLKIKAKKTGWYDLYNPSKSMETLFEFRNRKKNYTSGFAAHIPKGKKLRVYLNKGSYYIYHAKRHPGESSYLIARFEKAPKLKFIRAECPLKPDQKQLLPCDARKGVFFKFKALRTGSILLDASVPGNFSFELYNARKKKIAGDLYVEEGLFNMEFGVQQGKTYYLKLKYNDFMAVSDTFSDFIQYSYPDPDPDFQPISSYGHTKETAIPLSGFSQDGKYAGWIGLDGAIEEHWYAYDMHAAAHPRFWVPKELGWLNQKGIHLDYYDQNGTHLFSDTEVDQAVPPFSDWKAAGVSQVFMKISSNANCPSMYSFYFEPREDM